jgi:hypothetical protein
MNDQAPHPWLAIVSAVRLPPPVVRVIARSLIAVAVTAAPVAAQVKAKVLTPPRAADSTSRAPTVSRPPATSATTAGTPAPAPAARPAPIIPQSPVLDSIREVVFHSLLERDRTGFATLASAFCLGLSTDTFKKASSTTDRADPAEAMVRRLYSARTPARRASTCTFAPNAAAARPVSGRALLYSVGAIDLSSSDRAEAAAAYNYDGYSAGGYTFTVERADSGWVVKQWRMEWTSKPGTP